MNKRQWVRFIKILLCFLLFASVAVSMEMTSQALNIPVSDTWIELVWVLAAGVVAILSYWVIVFDVKKTRPNVWKTLKYIGFFISFILLVNIPIHIMVFLRDNA